MNNIINARSSVSNTWIRSCTRILDQIAKARAAVLSQFRDLVAEYEHALQLAVNEAEALAWQTQFPQLVFPELAQEKARGVVKWVAHQRIVRSMAFVEK
jgi:hypothetical protein